MSSDAELEVYPKNITIPNDQHGALQNLATTEVGVSLSDNRRECTIQSTLHLTWIK